MAYLSLLGIVAAVAIFIFMSMKRFSVYMSAIAATIVLTVFSQMNPYSILNESFMAGMSGFMRSYFILFLVSALFGRVMDETGSARSIALTLARLTKRSKSGQKLLTVMILCVFYTIMSYVGISGFVIAFTLLYIARDLFKEIDMPLWLYPYGSAGIFPAYALGGSLSTVNIVATQGFGVTLTAGFGLSVIAFVVYYIVLIVLVQLDIRKAAKREEGFLPSGGPLLTLQNQKAARPDEELPGFFKAFFPLLVPTIVITVFELDAVLALVIATVLCLLLNMKSIKSLPTTLTEGLGNGVLPIINVSCANGFARVIQSTAGFAIIVALIEPLPGLLPSMIMMSGMTFCVGSMTAFLGSFMEILHQWMLPLGISPELCARLLCIAGFTFMMPHNAGVVNGVTLSKLDFRTGIWIYFKGTTIPGLCGLVVCVVLVTLGIVH